MSQILGFWDVGMLIFLYLIIYLLLTSSAKNQQRMQSCKHIATPSDLENHNSSEQNSQDGEAELSRESSLKSKMKQ